MSDVIRETDKIVIKPGRDIVASNADEFKNELRELVKELPKEIEIDMSGVEIVDSPGIGVLVATNNSLEISEGKLTLTNVADSIYKMFTLMRLDSHFKIEKA